MRSVLTVLVAASCGTVLATGILFAGFAATAASKGYSVGAFYTELFPTFRGANGSAPIPAAVYADFFAYVAGAAEIAILCRRAIARRRFGR